MYIYIYIFIYNKDWKAWPDRKGFMPAGFSISFGCLKKFDKNTFPFSLLKKSSIIGIT